MKIKTFILYMLYLLFGCYTFASILPEVWAYIAAFAWGVFLGSKAQKEF